MSAVVWLTDWRKAREDRLAHGGVFAWFIQCQTHGRNFQADCLSCGMAENHNDDTLQELLAQGVVWLWDEPAADIPLVAADERTSRANASDSPNSNTETIPALRGDQESAS